MAQAEGANLLVQRRFVAAEARAEGLAAADEDAGGLVLDEKGSPIRIEAGDDALKFNGVAAFGLGRGEVTNGLRLSKRGKKGGRCGTRNRVRRAKETELCMVQQGILADMAALSATVANKEGGRKEGGDRDKSKDNSKDNSKSKSKENPNHGTDKTEVRQPSH